LKAHADVEEFARHPKVLLLDNNVLGCDHGIKQIEQIVRLELSVDFNQGLDAGLIDDTTAKLLAKVRWWKPLRLACDTTAKMETVLRAVTLLRWHNATPRRYFVYMIVNDVEDALERVQFLKGIDVDPFAQPFRDRDGNPPTSEQRHFARWVNHKAEFKSRTWEEYKEDVCLR
jgi:hypothetical protein